MSMNMENIELICIAQEMKKTNLQVSERILKEAATMQVSYNGFTGELVKLEKKETSKYTLSPYDKEKHPVWGYDISIYVTTLFLLYARWRNR